VNGGWRIWVAGCRVKEPGHELVPIGLPYDDARFACKTRMTTVRKLLWLRKIGYHVPEHAIERLNAEISAGRKQVNGEVVR